MDCGRTGDAKSLVLFEASARCISVPRVHALPVAALLEYERRGLSISTPADAVRVPYYLHGVAVRPCVRALDHPPWTMRAPGGRMFMAVSFAPGCTTLGVRC